MDFVCYSGSAARYCFSRSNYIVVWVAKVSFLWYLGSKFHGNVQEGNWFLEYDAIWSGEIVDVAYIFAVDAIVYPHD